MAPSDKNHMRELINFASHYDCPQVNGLMFPDGKIHLLVIEVDWSSPPVYKLTPGEETSLQALSEKRELAWNSCCVLAHLQAPHEGLDILAGECLNHGGDGFVAVIMTETQQLVWLALFDCSNPFIRLERDGQLLKATSSAGCVWTFGLDNPIQCEVVCNGSF